MNDPGLGDYFKYQKWLSGEEGKKQLVQSYRDWIYSCIVMGCIIGAGIVVVLAVVFGR